MHFMLSLEPGSVSAERAEEIFAQVTTCLGDHPHHRVFPHCWVVQVPGFGIYERLHVALREAAAGIEDTTVRFLLSPLLADASYRGRIDEETAKALPALSGTRTEES